MEIERFLGGLCRYVEFGVAPGSFLQAVISNDLRGALERADSEARYELFELVFFLYNECPSSCWGSPQAYSAWISMDRAERDYIVNASTWRQRHPKPPEQL